MNEYRFREYFFPMLDLENIELMMVCEKETEYSRRQRIEFHIDCDSYFGNLATILDIIVQDKKNFKQKRFAEALEHCRDDLIYLQKRYKIVRK